MRPSMGPASGTARPSRLGGRAAFAALAISIGGIVMLMSAAGTTLRAVGIGLLSLGGVALVLLAFYW